MSCCSKVSDGNPGAQSGHCLKGKIDAYNVGGAAAKPIIDPQPSARTDVEDAARSARDRLRHCPSTSPMRSDVEREGELRITDRAGGHFVTEK